MRFVFVYEVTKSLASYLFSQKALVAAPLPAATALLFVGQPPTHKRLPRCLLFVAMRVNAKIDARLALQRFILDQRFL